MILINHVGTSVLQSVENELMALVKEVRSIIDEEVVLTFNSKRAVEKLNAKGFNIKTALDMIDGAKENIIIMPVHLVGGMDLNKLKAQTDVTVLPALLTTSEDCRNLAEVLSQVIDTSKQTLMVGHGTSDISGRMYHELEDIMKAMGLNIKIMTLNDDPKTFNGDNEVVLMPLFAVAGYHVNNDMFQSPTSFKRLLLEMGYEVTCIEKGLLSYESVRQLYVNRLVR